MDSRNQQNIECLTKKIDSLNLLSPLELARALSLYIKTLNDNGVVSNVSAAYIDSYDGKTFHKRFSRQFGRMYEMFIRNGMGEDDRRKVFKAVARRIGRIPTNVKSMNWLYQVVVDESHSLLKQKGNLAIRQKIVADFRNAIKKYLHLTWELGFNEPSACAKTLARQHKIDKYIMSGDFPVILLPFMPDVEAEIRRNYEHYEMQDAWELLKGRYFNHRADFQNRALEIKSNFTRNIRNFSEYFDRMYIDTYYTFMLGKNNPQKQ